MIVVNEAYPPSCIRYHFGDFTVSANPRDHRVGGHEYAVVAQQSATESSIGSLQLKPDRAAMLLLQQTPSRTESGEQQPPKAKPDSHEGVMIELSLKTHPVTTPPQPHNALDEAIEEAKAIQDLVSLLKDRSL